MAMGDTHTKNSKEVLPASQLKHNEKEIKTRIIVVYLEGTLIFFLRRTSSNHRPSCATASSSDAYCRFDDKQS